MTEIALINTNFKDKRSQFFLSKSIKHISINYSPPPERDKGQKTIKKIRSCVHPSLVIIIGDINLLSEVK